MSRSNSDEVIRVGGRRELFVDGSLIDTVEHVEFRLHEPARREVVLQSDDPEFRRAGFHNLIHDGDRVRLYYRGVHPSAAKHETIANVPDVMGHEETNTCTTHYAESLDGVHFEHPELGIVEWRGSRRNNIILTGHDAQNFCVFRDDNPAALPEERYKAVGGDMEPPTIAGPKLGLHAYTSPDAIHWERTREEYLQVTGMFDSLNVPFWDRLSACYRLFSRFTEFRYATRGDPWPNYCRRDIQSCHSRDFIHWSQPRLHTYMPADRDEQYYTNATQPCPGAEHILLSFPMRFIEGRTKVEGAPYPGISDTVFMASRDGERWRRYPEAFVRPDMDPLNWVSRATIMASGIIPTSEQEWSLYMSECYSSTGNRLRRLVARPWGFVSLNAKAAGGRVTTKPLILAPGALHLNYATSAAGSVSVEVLAADGSPLPGFGRADADTLFGNELDGTVSWNGRSDLSGILPDTPRRLRFSLNDADLFAFRTV